MLDPLDIPCALEPGAHPPEQATEGAAGLDLRSVDHAWVYRGRRTAIRTGVRLAIPPGFVGLIRDRSGLAKRAGVSVLGGVIDSDYRGEISVILQSHGQEHLEVHPGDRIAQLLIIPIPAVRIREVDQLDETARGEGGFGSTGTR